jgi:hypothetical protein
MYSSILNKKEDFNELKRLQEYIKSANNFEELEIYDLCKRAYENCSKSLNNSEISKNNEIYKDFTDSLNQYFSQKKSIMETLIYFEEERKKVKENQIQKEKKNNDLLQIYKNNKNEINKMLNQIDNNLEDINNKFKLQIEESFVVSDMIEQSFIILEKNKKDNKNISNNNNDLNLIKNNSGFDDKEKLKEFLFNISECLEDVKKNLEKLEEYYNDIIKYENAKNRENEKLKILKNKYLELDKKLKKSINNNYNKIN